MIDLLDNQTPAINLDVAWSISGTFASDTEITGGGATGEFRCEGDGCDLILSDTGMSFPCGFEIADVSWTHAG